MTQSFSSQPIDQLFVSLQSSEKGLTGAVAEERMRVAAKSVKTKSRFNRRLRLLAHQFTSPLVFLLIVAVILSSVLGQSSDSFIILFILLATGLLGFWQELKASRAMELLNSMIDTKHAIVRDGKNLELSTHQVVPGDILLLNAGDIIPADCRIVDSNELHVNESSITGESYFAEKSAGVVEDNLPMAQKHNCLWKGANVVSGTGSALVVHTGEQTLFGEMAQSLIETQETAFEKGIKRFGYFLLRITVVLSLIILVVNVYFRKPVFSSVLFSLAVAVGMAPELLPAIMTFAMSRGAKRMLEKKVIVKKLSSIFNFGEVNILCTDKTGTITEGNVKVRDIVDINEKTNDRLRHYAWLNAMLQNGFTNPLDQAIASLNFSLDGYEKINEIPYDFIRKRLSVAVNTTNGRLIITKGAFTNIAEVCSDIQSENEIIKPIDETRRTEMQERFIAYSRRGFRVLGLACKELKAERMNKDDEQQMTFLGYILLEDPLKASARESIQRLEQLQVKVKIVTGDNRFAAANAAQNIGMTNPVVLTGPEMATMHPDALLIKVKATDIFAEIEPQQKELIIRALQKSAFTVAYIGDGINDVTAINAADIGISTSNAVDVAKEAADFVLIEKDLSVLADGIIEGRKCFANSMKYILITTGATFGNMFSVAGASLLLPFLPMLPQQILLTNLITDLPFLTIASDHVERNELNQPGKWDLKMIQSFMIVFGLHSSLFDFITFYILYFYFHLSGAPFQTGWFLESCLTELVILFIVRTRKTFIKSKPGKWLLISGILAFCITIYLPFSPFATVLNFSVAHKQQALAILIILVLYVITADLLKILFFRLRRHLQLTEFDFHRGSLHIS